MILGPILAVCFLLWLGWILEYIPCSITLLTGRSSKTVWMNDKAKHDPGDLHDPDWKNVFTFAETNTVELGLRLDGTVVWRKSN